MKKITLWISLIAVLALCSGAQADFITGGSGAGGDAFFTLTQDVTFNIEAGISAQQIYFVIDEASAGGVGTPVGAAGMIYQVNGAGSQALVNWTDSMNANIGDLTPNDAYITGQIESLSIGNTITLKAGTHTSLQTVPGFQVFDSGAYDVFVTDAAGVRISDVQAVPEPATMGLLGLSGLLLFAVRRLQKSYGLR